MRSPQMRVLEISPFSRQKRNVMIKIVGISITRTNSTTSTGMRSRRTLREKAKSFDLLSTCFVNG